MSDLTSIAIALARESGAWNLPIPSDGIIRLVSLVAERVRATCVANILGGAICNPQQIADDMRNLSVEELLSQPGGQEMTANGALLARLHVARNWPANTCGASRHAEQIGRQLLRGDTAIEEPEYAAESILAAVCALWEARSEITRLRAALDINPRRAGGNQ